jgi:hypothetical protein
MLFCPRFLTNRASTSISMGKNESDGALLPTSEATPALVLS